MRKLLLVAVGLSVVLACTANAQLHAGAFLGFKSYGLKAAGTVTQSGTPSAMPTSDAGGTVLGFGGFGGYTPVSVGVYSLDVQLAASFASIGFYERGYNNSPGSGSGKFAADGYSGATTSVIEFDVLGLNRLSFPTFKLIEPFAGAGLSFNIYSTSDLNYGPPANNQSGTVKGNSTFKMGIVITYGAIAHVTPLISPYVQLSHLIPFGSEFQLTNDPVYTVVVKDVPGYFALNAGVRFDL